MANNGDNYSNALASEAPEKQEGAGVSKLKSFAQQATQQAKAVGKKVGAEMRTQTHQEYQSSQLLPEPVPGVPMKPPIEFPKSDEVIIGYVMYIPEGYKMCCLQLDISSVTLHCDTCCFWLGLMCFSMPVSFNSPLQPYQRPVYGKPEDVMKKATSSVAPQQQGMH